MPGMQSGLEQFLLLRTWRWTRRGSWTWCRPGRLLNGAGSLSAKQLRRLSHPHHARIAQGAVSEFPLVVVVLLLIDNDGLLGTGGRKADDARAAEGLSGNRTCTGDLAAAGVGIAGVGRIGAGGLAGSGIGIGGVAAGVGYAA